MLVRLDGIAELREFSVPARDYASVCESTSLGGLKPAILLGLFGTRPRGCPGRALTQDSLPSEFFRSL
jgi:hypothetical protein